MRRWNSLRLVGIILVVASFTSANHAAVTRRNQYQVDCSQFQQVQVVDKLRISYTSLLDEDVGPNGYLRVELVYKGLAWVAWGTSQNVSGKMAPGYAVIGIPNPTDPIPAYNPGKYSMVDQTPTGVTLMNDTAQTLLNATIKQNSTHTTLTFTKRLIESGEFDILGNGQNTFQVAYGYDNYFTVHAYRAAFNHTLKQCVDGATLGAPPTATTSAPSPAPTIFTAAPTANKTGEGVNCNEYQQVLGLGNGVETSYTSVLDDSGTNGYLHVQMAYAGQGWLGWGISGNKDGRMVPGEAVIGIPGDSSYVGKYNLNGYTTSGVTPYDDSQQTLQNASIFQNSSHTVLTFSKRLQESGEYDINGNGVNFFFVAWGTSNELADHGATNRQSFQYQLYPCVNGAAASAFGNGNGATFIASETYKLYWNAHGVLSAVAWGIVAPLAIGASLLRNYLTSDSLPAGLWFKIHQYFMLTVLLLTVLSFVFAVVAIEKQGTQEHFRQVKHRTTGLVITVLAVVQILGGLFRPHLPHHHHDEEEDDDAEYHDEKGNGHDSTTPVKKHHEPPQKPAIRLFWEIGHRLLGASLLAFSWWQVQDGLELYALRFAVTKLTNVFWGITGAISGIIVLLYILRLVQSK